jgi:hypothetical protein
MIPIQRVTELDKRVDMKKKKDRKEPSTQDKKHGDKGGNRIKKKIAKSAGVAVATGVIAKKVKSGLKGD